MVALQNRLETWVGAGKGRVCVCMYAFEVPCALPRNPMVGSVQVRLWLGKRARRAFSVEPSLFLKTRGASSGTHTSHKERWTPCQPGQTLTSLLFPCYFHAEFGAAFVSAKGAIAPAPHVSAQPLLKRCRAQQQRQGRPGRLDGNCC